VWERGTFLDTKLSFDAGVFRLEHFLLWFDQRCGLLDPRLRRAVLDYVRRSGALAGKRGTGLYSHSQLQTFNYMLGLHHSHKPMTAGTRAYLGKNESKYQYTDESVKGLIARHEYSVSDVYKVGDFCFIRLINPWGNTGRSTILVPPDPQLNPFGKSAQVVETGQGEFDLELDDFTKRFRAVFHTVQSLRPADQ
jgi:hypothetical protein